MNAGEVAPARQEELLAAANVVGAAPCPGQASPSQRLAAETLAAELREGKPLSLLDVLRRLWP